MEFGDETVQGALSVWRLDGSLVDGWNPLPRQAYPLLWLADRGTEQSLSSSFDLGEEAGSPYPMFLRATLGIVDSDNDGIFDSIAWKLGYPVTPPGMPSPDPHQDIPHFSIHRMKVRP